MEGPLRCCSILTCGLTASLSAATVATKRTQCTPGVRRDILRNEVLALCGRTHWQEHTWLTKELLANGVFALFALGFTTGYFLGAFCHNFRGIVLAPTKTMICGPPPPSAINLSAPDTLPGFPQNMRPKSSASFADAAVIENEKEGIGGIGLCAHAFLESNPAHCAIPVNSKQYSRDSASLAYDTKRIDLPFKLFSKSFFRPTLSVIKRADISRRSASRSALISLAFVDTASVSRLAIEAACCASVAAIEADIADEPASPAFLVASPTSWVTTASSWSLLALSSLVFERNRLLIEDTLALAPASKKTPTTTNTVETTSNESQPLEGLSGGWTMPRRQFFLSSKKTWKIATNSPATPIPTRTAQHQPNVSQKRDGPPSDPMELSSAWMELFKAEMHASRAESLSRTLKMR